MTFPMMTPLERFAAYGRGDALDRLPCVPIIGNGAARVIGCKISEFRGDGKRIAEAQIAAYRLFGYDGVRVFTDLYLLAEAMGARVHYPEDETAHLEAPAIADPAQIAALRPADPYLDGNLPHHLEAMGRVLAEVGREVPVSGAVVCPFTTASFLLGADKLIRATMNDPLTVHALCRLSLKTALRYAEAIIDIGCTPSLTEPVSTCAVIGPRQFREFSYPYIKELIDYIHSRGKTATLHICGKTSRIWRHMAAAGADCISIDEVEDIGAAKEAVGAEVRIMGNVSPTEIMLLGTPVQVRSATLDCIMRGHDNPRGFIVASGCSLPTEAPFANIRAMMETVREVGWPVSERRLHRLRNSPNFASSGV